MLAQLLVYQEISGSTPLSTIKKKKELSEYLQPGMLFLQLLQVHSNYNNIVNIWRSHGHGVQVYHGLFVEYLFL